MFDGQGGASGEASPLPEGAMLQMIGQVRLVRLPQTEEAPAVPDVRPPGSGTDVPLAEGVPRGRSSRPGEAIQLQALGHRPGPSGSGPSPGLIPVPVGPPPLEDGSKELQVIGKPRLITADGPEVKLSPSDIELLARLALTPGRTFSAEELRTDMGAAKDSDWTAGTLWTRASSLRRSVGTEHLPVSSRGSGYRVVGIGTDVARFEASIAGSRADPANAVGFLAEALSLVRGVPFANVPTGTFTWALDAGGVATRVGNAVYAAAVDLAQMALAAGGVELATWAVAQGRLVFKDEEVLDVLDLEAAAISHDRSALGRTWAALKRRYGALHQAVPLPVADAYRRLSGK